MFNFFFISSNQSLKKSEYKKEIRSESYVQIITLTEKQILFYSGV